ncbi:MAG: response regulator [Acidobacteriota bacterium]
MRILIADDEESYREYLRASLAGQGHEVSTVDNGRVAIDYGVRLRPSILVVDWMLKQQLHGLQVSRVLRAVDPKMQTILITGFASADLKEEARNAGVFGLIEKPFELGELLEKIEKASGVKRKRPPAPLFAALEVDSTGAIVNANDKARDLFAKASAGRRANSLENLFGQDAITYLVESNERWINVSPISRKQVRWWARSRTWPDGGILVLLPESEESLQENSLVQMLLDTTSTAKVAWPFDDHVLIIDDVKKTRSLCAQLLEQAGVVCYKAETPELASKLFEADPSIGVVILDGSSQDSDLEHLVSEFRNNRPAVKIVDYGAGDQRPGLEENGTVLHLDKDWEISELIDVLKECT